ncbi:MAG: nucleotidyltransferase domain-containing protein [Candidatus Eremiobacteraeota bacterium]|nr:nucleotidyltransferase domain-containing protein [Candidatus Eremiobacteraeota bacterium]
MIDIKPGHKEIIDNILKEHVPEFEVRAFGSRVNGTAKSYSDLDLVLVGNQEVSIRKLRQLEDAFQESDLPFRVDVIDWNRISDEFRKVIEKGFEVIWKTENGRRLTDPYSVICNPQSVVRSP